VSTHPRPLRLIAWFADNPVAANLLMAVLLLGGLLGLREIRQEITPDFSIPGVRIEMAYPGAGPEAVEQGLVLPIERALQDIDTVIHVQASAGEGSARLTAELREEADPAQALQDIREALSRIRTFPAGAEPPRVSLRRHGFYVISIGVAAELSPRERYHLGENLRQRLLALEDVADVQVRGGLTPEIHFEIPWQALRDHDLTLAEVAERLRAASADLPAGRLESARGEVLLRSQGHRDQAREFADIPLRTNPDGGLLRLRDIARIEDGFAESRQIFEFNGRPGLRLDVYQIDSADPVQLAAQVRELVAGLQARLPESVAISVQNDRSERLAERRAILLRNGALGLMLVILALGIFLDLRLAFWVTVSIPVVFIGSLAVLPHLDVSLNMISLFAFILAVGIVVDDAIIVGENIHARRQQGLPLREAVALGASEMAIPVLFAVGTNILAFLPLLAVPGAIGQFMRDLPIVASVVFAVSLIEALLVLPAHLHRRDAPPAPSHNGAAARLRALHQRSADLLDRLRDGPYRRLLGLVLRHRYLTLTLFCGGLALMAAWYASGRIDLTWRPEIPGNRVDAELDMPVDASLEQTLAMARRVEQAGLRAIEALGGRQYLESWFTRTGSRRPTYGEVSMILVPDAHRPFTQEAFTREWRRQLGEVPEVKSLFFEYLVGPGGNRSLQLALSHRDRRVLAEAARELARSLQDIDGVVDVNDGTAQGKRQLSFTPTAEAHVAGLDEAAIGRPLRDAFQGAEVRRLLRNGHEVRVLVRLTAAQRADLATLADYPVRTPDGHLLPLSQVADIHWGRAPAAIQREDGRRILTVSASIDKAHANSRQIRARVQEQILPALRARYPGLETPAASSRRDRQRTFDHIFRNLGWAALVMFALFSALFRSYGQAVMVMLTIPFAIAGAMAGHVLLGYDLSSVSLYGMIALGGLAVNGALVLALRHNRLRSLSPQAAIEQAALDRFRPIVLTTLTTTLGVTPMLFETALQARFLVPMAIALSFGTLAAMLAVLLLVPVMLRIGNDLEQWRRNTAKT